MQVIHSSTIRLNSLSGCQNIFFLILFACLIESHILILSAVVAAIFYGALEKKMSQQRNEIINESTDKNAHKFISAIIRLIRLFCVQATTDFCSVGLFFRSVSKNFNFIYEFVPLVFLSWAELE